MDETRARWLLPVSLTLNAILTVSLIGGVAAVLATRSDDDGRSNPRPATTRASLSPTTVERRPLKTLLAAPSALVLHGNVWFTSGARHGRIGRIA